MYYSNKYCVFVLYADDCEKHYVWIKVFTVYKLEAI